MTIHEEDGTTHRCSQGGRQLSHASKYEVCSPPSKLYTLKLITTMAEFRPPNEYQDIAQPDFDFWNDLHLPSYEDQDDQRLSLPYAEPTGDEQIIFGFTSVTASSHHDDPWTSTSGDNVSSTVNDDRPRPSIGALGTSSIAEDDRMELSSSQYHHGDASLLTCEYTPLSFSMPLPHTTNFANPNESQKLLIAHPTSAHERMDFLDADFRPSDDRSPCQASTTFVKSSPDKRSLTTGHDKESNQK